MAPDQKIIRSDLWDGKYTNNSSVSMMCFPEIQIPPMDICVYIQWEGSSLDLAYTRQENMNKGYIVFKLIYQQTLPHNHISVILSQRHIRSSH